MHIEKNISVCITVISGRNSYRNNKSTVHNFHSSSDLKTKDQGISIDSPLFKKN